MPTVLVKEWPLVCTMFNGDQLMGPVPTLFAENVEVKITRDYSSGISIHTIFVQYVMKLKKYFYRRWPRELSKTTRRKPIRTF